MAEFCKQCAEELDFPADFIGLFEENGLQPDGNNLRGFLMLCETCGPAFIVDDEGTCAAVNCDRKHGATHGRL